MTVSGGDDNGEAQEWDGWSAMEMYHVLAIIVSIFDTQQTWIDAGNVAYGSNLVMAESDKGLNISNLPLEPTQQKTRC